MIEALSEINQYLYSKIQEKDSLLLELENYAKENNVPIVTKEVAEFLKMLLKIKPCKNALEIGTAIGYSGIYIAREISGILTTLEIDPDRYQQAEENFKRATLNNVKQVLGDATEEISKIQETFDFIFIDASKGQYQKFFEDAYPKLNPGGIVLIDNILFRSYVSQKEVPKRFKTLVRRLDSFIDFLYSEHQFSLLPFGDGLGIVHKEK